ncbi:hypothetical protein A3Q56_03048 [Intoshia linei]|uniref:Proline-rich protein PRCC n=1 Tax=Intoshia linei TaxID=1819745 RepID=A0A177B4K2_9BILA|nr:hypothetical protein A3Q56_03048 [Intoshia linei]
MLVDYQSDSSNEFVKDKKPVEETIISFKSKTPNECKIKKPGTKRIYVDLSKKLKDENSDEEYDEYICNLKNEKTEINHKNTNYDTSLLSILPKAKNDTRKNTLSIINKEKTKLFKPYVLRKNKMNTKEPVDPQKNFKILLDEMENSSESDDDNEFEYLKSGSFFDEYESVETRTNNKAVNENTFVGPVFIEQPNIDKTELTATEKILQEEGVPEYDVMDIAADDRDDYINRIKNYSMEQAIPGSIAKSAMGKNKIGKRKHQITYLAAQAKANEVVLKNKWSESKENKRFAKMKYGF